MKIADLKSPIVLVHGLCGFDRFDLGRWTLAEYFPGIPALLRGVGNTVLTPRLSPTRSIAHRAQELKAYLNRFSPAEPVHVIAHSMGGLDARYMISKLGMAGRVLSLTTLGTPHRGTSFADWGIRNLSRVVCPVLRFLGIPTDAFHDLTTASCRRFNEDVRPAPGVRYFSVAGVYAEKKIRLEWLLPHGIVTQHEGPNDGVVSVASAEYGETMSVWPGDHLRLANWPGGFLFPAGKPSEEGAVLFHRISGRLKDEGF